MSSTSAAAFAVLPYCMHLWHHISNCKKQNHMLSSEKLPWRSVIFSVSTSGRKGHDGKPWLVYSSTMYSILYSTPASCLSICIYQTRARGLGCCSAKVGAKWQVWGVPHFLAACRWTCSTEEQYSTWRQYEVWNFFMPHCLLENSLLQGQNEEGSKFVPWVK